MAAAGNKRPPPETSTQAFRGVPIPTAAPPRSPTCMEVLDEFDREFPQSVTFCQLISEEDFERQATTYTERALRRLFRSLDRNPALAERVVRKSKQTECEQRGLLSFLWVRGAGAAGDRVGIAGAFAGPLGRGLGMGEEGLAGVAGLGWAFQKPEATQLGECSAEGAHRPAPR